MIIFECKSVDVKLYSVQGISETYQNISVPFEQGRRDYIIQQDEILQFSDGIYKIQSNNLVKIS